MRMADAIWKFSLPRINAMISKSEAAIAMAGDTEGGGASKAVMNPTGIYRMNKRSKKPLVSLA
jgi:hypothetical protein